MRALMTLLTLCAALAVAGPAQAQTRDPQQMATTHGDNGSRAMASRDYTRALAEYLLAYAYDARPERLIEIARVYEALGNRPVALELYQRVSDVAQTGATADQARQRIQALGGTAPAAPQAATIQLTVVPPGAEVYVDGQLRGRAPLPPVAVSPGPHRIEVVLPGYGTFTETITAQLGTPTSKVVTLMPGASTPPQAAEAPGAPTTTQAANEKPTLPATPSAATDTLAGSWFAVELEKPADLGISRKATLELTSETSGVLTMDSQQQLAQWKRKQCDNAENVNWTSEYTVRLVKTNGGVRLVGSGGRLTECSCKGICPNDGSIEMELHVSPNKQVMVGNDMVFQRRRGSAVPELGVREQIDISTLGGTWFMTMGSIDDPKPGQLTLEPSGRTLSGSLQQKMQAEIARWRAKKECGGETTVTATQHYSVQGKPEGKHMMLSFDHEKFSDCSCSPAACAAITNTARVGNTKVWQTLDGDHLVARGVLISRQ